jgi:hypothetical protein
VFFHAGYGWEAVFTTAGADVVLVEGEKKAIAGCKAGLNTIGLGGVWSWKSKASGVSLLPELAAMSWAGRPVYLCFDSDASTNTDVAKALAALSETLTALGAKVATATMPEEVRGEKVGLDDFIVKHGIDAVHQHLAKHAGYGELTAKLWAFNARFAVIHDPATVLDEEAHDSLDLPAQRLLNPTTFKKVLFANVQAVVAETVGGEDKAKPVAVAEKWLEWPARRQYEHLTYAPGEPRVLNHGSRYNSWMGLAVEPRKGCVKPWAMALDHIFKDSPREHRLWFERWMGWPLKHLGAKLSSAVGIWGKPGRGKSVLAEKVLATIYGSNFASIAQQDLEGSFNGWAVGRQFVLVDEVSAEDSRTRGHRFKKMITQTEMQVNVKFIPGYSLPDHVNYYMTSNSPRAFHVEDDDRRFFIHHAPDEQLPREFWNDFVDRWLGFHNAPKYGPGPAALLHYFMHDLDYGDFDPKAPPPMTASKEEMIEIARHPCEDWLRHFAETEHFKTRGGREIYSIGELCLLYRGTGGRGADSMAPNIFGAHLSGAGMPRKLVRAGEDVHRLVAVANTGKWATAKPAAWAAELQRTGDFGKREKF